MKKGNSCECNNFQIEKLEKNPKNSTLEKRCRAAKQQNGILNFYFN